MTMTEYAAEMKLAAKTELRRDLGNGGVAIQQHFFGHALPHAFAEFFRRFARDFLEHLSKTPRA